MRVLLLCGLLWLAGVAHAATDAQRSLFLETLKAARHGTLDSQQTALSRLQTYPLYDYLPAAQLEYQLRTSPDAKLDTAIRSFIDNHPQLPPAQRLRRHWLISLAKRKRWQQVLDNADADDGTRIQCDVVHARIALGAHPDEAALKLWRAGHSQPATCNPVFAWLETQGLLTPAVILERARLALLSGHDGLVQYLAQRLPDDLADRTTRWLGIAEHPGQLSGISHLDGDIAVYAFKRLALRDLDTAATELPRLVARLHLNADQRYQMRRYVALLYAENHESPALIWFARIDHARMADDEHALDWEIRAAIYQQRWPLVVDAIRALPAQFAGEEKWRYWLARALAATGDTRAAHAIYTRLARKRSYYGYLAADALGRKYSLNEQPTAADATARAKIEARPALARARELHALGMLPAANREWYRVIAGLNKTELVQAARIAYQWQWYSRAITTLAEADYWNDLAIRYPLPFSNAVESAASHNHLDPAYVLAIIRTESLFQPEAHSAAGAIGLMQLMPGTARHIAAAMGRPAPAPAMLDEPHINIPLGSHYLRQMLNRWHDNMALATASYNAGPHKIASWLPEQRMPADIWIANIPYTETRHYVQRAMAHMTVFQRRLGEGIVPLAKRLDPVKPAYPDPDNSE